VDKQRLLERIERAKRYKATRLNLYNNKLSTLPEQIGQLTNLTKLNLHSNQLSTLPAEIGKLANLTTLNLKDNQLTQLPAEIGQLTNLTTLYLNDNQLRELPEQIGQLTNLRHLHLRSNKLSTLPAEIGQLTNLTTLYLNDNQLTQLPAEIGKLLANLTTLNLQDNQLRELPEQIGQLTNLTTLWLNGNQLSELPEQIGQLTKLTELDLNYNNFDIPPEVHEMEPVDKINYILQNQKKSKSIHVKSSPITETGVESSHISTTRVFISYSTKDRDFVEKEIIALLKEHNIGTWYSKDNIVTAEDWERSIVQGLKKCEWFLLVMSPNSASSRWVRSELAWALANREGKIIPVMIEKCDYIDFNLRLNTIQHVDFTNPDNEARRKLLACWGIE